VQIQSEITSNSTLSKPLSTNSWSQNGVRPSHMTQTANHKWDMGWGNFSLSVALPRTSWPGPLRRWMFRSAVFEKSEQNWFQSLIDYTSLCFVQMITVYSPLTWGIYDEPPPDIPECGFVGERCLPPIRGKSYLLENRRSRSTRLDSFFASYKLLHSLYFILCSIC